MMSMTKITKNTETVLYLFFGVCTTLINIFVYFCLYNIFNMGNVVSVVAAWMLSVAFAFVTNKLYVFKSVSFEKRVFCREAASFFATRIFSGAMEVFIMYAAVDVMLMNSTICKIATNIIVIAVNYIISKFCVFRQLHK